MPSIIRLYLLLVSFAGVWGGWRIAWLDVVVVVVVGGAGLVWCVLVVG